MKRFGGLFLFLAAAAYSAVPVPGVYLNSEDSPVLAIIDAAKKNLDIEIYTMSDPSVLTAIRNALNRGVRVRIIQEPSPVGGKCRLFAAATTELNASAECQGQKSLLADVRSHGGDYVPFNKETLCVNGKGCLEHGKLVIADDIALVMTGNLDSSNLCINNPSRCNRDFTLVTRERAAVKTLQGLFEADLKGESYQVESLIPYQMKALLTVSPASLEPILALINSATRTIELETQYLKSKEMNDALIAAANRGVKVSVTVASFCAFGRPKGLEIEATKNIYPAFDQAGISSRMFTSSNKINGKPGYMHAKVMVVDGVRAWLGSENGSDESLKRNREYGLIFSQPEWVEAIRKVALADHASAGTESWQESLKCFKDRDVFEEE